MKIKTSLESGKGFEKPHVAEGQYEAKLIEVKDISDGQYGRRVAIIYEVTDKPNTPVQLSHICYVPEVATPDNKFGKFLLAHGVNLANNGEIDTSPLVGTMAKAYVEDYEADDDGKKVTASSIAKLKPLVEEPKKE